MWKAFLSDDVIKSPTEFNRYTIRCALFDFVVVTSSFCSSFLWSIYTYSLWPLLLHWAIANRKIDPMPIKSISKPLDGNVPNRNASTSSVFYWKQCGVRNEIAAILHIVISKHLFEGHFCTLRQIPMKFINEESLSELMKTLCSDPNTRRQTTDSFYPQTSMLFFPVSLRPFVINLFIMAWQMSWQMSCYRQSGHDL